MDLRFASWVSLVLGFVLGARSLGQDVTSEWSRFRGPNGGGLATNVILPTDLRPEAAAWSAKLPGAGHSCPVVLGERLWITSYDEDRKVLVLSCFTVSTGELLWSREHHLATHPMHRLNNPATSTPTVDVDGVYQLVMEPDHLWLIAWSHQGEEKWRRDFGPWVAQHGFAASPIVFRNQVIVLNSQEPWEGLPPPGDSRLISIRTDDGTETWSCDLVENKACYATPLVWEDTAGKSWFVCATQGDGVVMVDPANGQRVWNRTVFQQRTVGSPVLSGNRLIANNGSGGGGNYVVSVDLLAGEHPTVWEVRQGAGYVPSVIEVEGRVYLFADNGVVTCVQADSGKELWRERLSDGFWASPVSDGRSIYCLDKNGVLKVLKAGEQFQLLGSFDLGAPSQATAAIAAGRIFFRTTEKLWCFQAEAAR